MNRRKQAVRRLRWMCFLMACIMLVMVSGVSFAAGAEDEELSLHALSAVLMDADSGRILYAKDADTIRPMASTTKIMTCILALENGTLTDICTVSEHAAAQPQVHLGAPAGTEFVLEDLLYSLMLESHNDSAVVIAEHIGGSVDAFAAMMNRKAQEIGCENTFFVTPNGLDASVTLPDGTEQQHSTTAADLAAIMRYCVYLSPMREKFLEITKTQSRSFADVSARYSFYCGNHNALLQMLDGAVSGKTGFTGGAGYCYVAAYENGGRSFVAALLGCGWPPHKGYKWEDVRRLFAYGAEHYEYQDIYLPPETGSIPVKGGITEAPVPLSDGLTDEDRRRRLLLADGETVERNVTVPDHLNAPVSRGDPAGRVVYSLDETVLWVCPLSAAGSVPAWDYPYCIRSLAEAFWKVSICAVGCS